MFRAFSLLMFKLIGWRVVDHRPAGIQQAIYVVAPHTSNWDFLIGVFARSIARLGNARYLAKSSLFKPPFGWLFYALGGYPVDRSKSTHITDQVVGYFRQIPDFSIAITPEGTRKHVTQWKTGFWRIAQAANVPLVLTSFDYVRKEVTLNAPRPTGPDMDQDIADMMDFFKQFKGKRAEEGVR
jgi:1-acyl-sn-glycerol-3-phosphate acyltransferase